MRTRAPIRRRRLAAVAALVALALAKGLGLALLEPPFHGPDEPYHFDHAQAIAENRSLPTPAAECGLGSMFSAEVRAASGALVVGTAFHPERPLAPPTALDLPSGQAARATTGCGPASIYPPLWYLSAAAGQRLAGGGTLWQRLLATRLVSVAWSAIAAVAALYLGLLVAGSFRSALAFGAMVVLQPMAGVLNALANSEPAAMASAAVALAAVAALHRGVAPLGARLVLALALVGGVLSKPGFALALPCLAALAALALRRRPRPILEAALLAAPALLALAAFTLAHPERLGIHEEIPSSGPFLQQLWVRVLAPRRLLDVWVEQYWLKHGWMDTNLARPWYLAIAAAVALGLAGLGRIRRHASRDRAVALAVVAGSALMALALYAVAWRRGDLIWVQGRMLLVLWPAHAYLLHRGLSSWHPAAPAAFALLLVAVNAAGAFAAWRRFYAPPGAASTLAAWQAQWQVPLLAPAGLAALALALGILVRAWPRPALGAG